MRLQAEGERPSKRCKTQLSAFLQANVDVMGAIAKHRIQHEDTAAATELHPLADVSQHIERSQIRTNDTVPTLHASSRIFSYELNRLITPPELLHSMGFPDARAFNIIF